MEDSNAPNPAASAAASPQESLLTLASLGLIAEHLSEPLFAKDRSHRFVLVNRAFCELVHLSREALLGQSEADLHGREGEVEQEALVLEKHSPLSGQRQFETPDGLKTTRPATYLPLTDSDGSVTHVVCVVGHAGESIASSDRLQEEMNRYAVEHTRALRAVQQDMLRRERLMVLGQIAAGVAHQVRNPLAEITLALALARKHAPADGDALRETLKLADVGVTEANRIITDLVDYARIRAPRPMYMPLLDIVTAALHEECPPPEVRVILEIPDVEVYVDPQQVRDALRKVIRNAHESMDGKGELRLEGYVTSALETSGPQTAPIPQSGECKQPLFAELRISDTGVGVSEQHRALLFEPMVTGKPLGLGLGLTTALTLVTHQGGTLECLPNIAPGATFLMKLPLHASAAHRKDVS